MMDLLEMLIKQGMTFKEFKVWYGAREADGKWLSHEALLCSTAMNTCRKKWFGKEKFWNDNFKNDVIVKAVYPFALRMEQQRKTRELYMGLINFKEMGLDRYEVLCALYNHSRPLGLGILHYTPKDLTIAEAREHLEQTRGYADYVNGRVIKVSLPEDAETFDPRLYDRDNGEGAALQAVEEYAKNKGVA